MKISTLRILGLSTLFSILGTTVMLSPAFAQDSADRPAMQGGSMHGPMGGPRGGRGSHRQAEPDNLIERLDSNDDGKVSLEEFVTPALARIDSMFERRDTNNDGLISEGEGRPEGRGPGRNGGDRPQRGAPERADIDPAELVACVRRTIPDFDPPRRADADDTENRFDETDTNNDGNLSLAEVTAALQASAEARFDQLDTDGDNFITAAEIEARQQQRQQDRQDVRSAMQACVSELAAG